MATPYYQDDYVTLYLGDCLELTQWLDADVLVTDPPYGVSYKDSDGRSVSNDRDSSTRDSALEVWGHNPSLVFGGWKTPRPPNLRNLLIWDKGNYVGSYSPTPWGYTHEEIYVLGDWPIPEPGGRLREGGNPSRVPGVIRVQQPNNQSSNKDYSHPTPKPVALMELLIERCPNGVIADPFAGSGSTLVAARNLGRKAIGVELEERYCEIIARRLSQGAFDFEVTS